MMCYSRLSSECCSFYDNDMCASQCTPPEVPDENFDCGKKFHIVLIDTGQYSQTSFIIVFNRAALSTSNNFTIHADEKSLRNHCLPYYIYNWNGVTDLLIYSLEELTLTGVKLTTFLLCSSTRGYVVGIYNLMSCAVSLHSALVLLNLATVFMCPQLQNPGNGSVTLSMDTLEMSTATYSCNFGFVQIAGNTSRTCQVDGSWSGEAPTCQCKLNHEVIPCTQS